jgi:general secretion pathway protein J
MHFGEPVVLLRSPFRLSFAYAGEDRIWKSNWRDSDKLPAAIRLTVRDAASERILSISTIAPVHVQSPAQNDCAQAADGCDGKSVAPENSQGNSQENSQGNSQGSSQTGNAATGQGGMR